MAPYHNLNLTLTNAEEKLYFQPIFFDKKECYFDSSDICFTYITLIKNVIIGFKMKSCDHVYFIFKSFNIFFRTLENPKRENQVNNSSS